MKSRVYLAMLLLVVSIVTFTSACGTREKRLSRVLITGEADAHAQPDTAVLVLSVVTESQKALDAQQQNARKSEAVIAAVNATAGANAEIRTSDYSLQPQKKYDYNRLPSIIGYEARNTVTATLGDLNNVGAVLDAASRAGANSVESVSFILRESNPARGETLAEASRQAMSKAQAIAQALGGRVVRVVEAQEGDPLRRPLTVEEQQRGYEAYAATRITASVAQKPAITPVEAGSLNVRSQVQLIVEIETQP